MSDFQELRLVAAARPNLDDRAAVQESILEIIEDINSIKDQWNDCIYPLLGSLPDQAIVVARGSRSADIDPVVNGLDGSQVFVDMASRPNELNGLLHNGERPKTIKEAIVETNQSVLARVSAIEALVAAVEAGAAGYDDTELREWVTALAGETWDPDEIAAGATFNTANFAAAPTKSSTTSLWQRILNMRHLVGVEGEVLTLQDISGLFAGANYISADTDIVTALMTLDSELFAAVPVAPSLQTAYNNGEAIALAASTPVSITTNGSSTDDTALQLYGKLDFQDTATGAGAAAKISSTYTLGTDTTDFSIFGGGDALLSAPAADDLLLKASKAGSSSYSVLTIGKETATGAAEYAILELGRETVGDGGAPRFKIEDDGANTIQLGSLQAVEVQSTGAGIVLDAATSLALTGLATADLSGGDLTLASTSGLLDINSAGAIDVDAIDGVTIDAGSSIAVANSVGNITIAADDTGAGVGHVRIASDGDSTWSGFKTTGPSHDLELAATQSSSDASLYGAGAAMLSSGLGLLSLSSSTGWRFVGDNTAFVAGIDFYHATVAPTTPGLAVVADDGSIGSIAYSESLFADANWTVGASGLIDGLVTTMAAFEPTGWAPTNGIASAANPHRLYKDNIIKAMAKIEVDVSKLGNTNAGQTPASFNVQVGGGATSWDGAGVLTVGFETPLDHSGYTVTVGYDSVQDMTFKIQNQTVNGFDITCRHLSGGAFVDTTNADLDFTIHFQVV